MDAPIGNDIEQRVHIIPVEHDDDCADSNYPEPSETRSKVDNDKSESVSSSIFHPEEQHSEFTTSWLLTLLRHFDVSTHHLRDLCASIIEQEARDVHDCLLQIQQQQHQACRRQGRLESIADAAGNDEPLSKRPRLSAASSHRDHTCSSRQIVSPSDQSFMLPAEQYQKDQEKLSSEDERNSKEESDLFQNQLEMVARRAFRVKYMADLLRCYESTMCQMRVELTDCMDGNTSSNT